MDEKKVKKVLVLTTGGTMAGLATHPEQPLNYQAASLNGEALMATLGISPAGLIVHEIAQIDSKDMDEVVWRRLLKAVDDGLNDLNIEGIVITHGSDTAEETAYLLHAVFKANKPLVLTCAMRPANALDSDGARNLHDAISVAKDANWAGVCLVCAGEIHAAQEVFKAHSTRLNAFSSGEQGPIGRVSLQCIERLRGVEEGHATKDSGQQAPLLQTLLDSQAWPRVEVVFNHAQADGRLVRAVLAHEKPDGILVAGTGNGTMSQGLRDALKTAQTQGVQVVLTSRCAQGGVIAVGDNAFESLGPLSWPQARVALVLRLMQARA